MGFPAVLTEGVSLILKTAVDSGNRRCFKRRAAKYAKKEFVRERGSPISVTQVIKKKAGGFPPAFHSV